MLAGTRRSKAKSVTESVNLLLWMSWFEMRFIRSQPDELSIDRVPTAADELHFHVFLQTVELRIPKSEGVHE
jgi:hypothetical protein